jgi:hypothetical protein
METSPVAGILSVTPGTCEKRILRVSAGILSVTPGTCEKRILRVSTPIPGGIFTTDSVATLFCGCTVVLLLFRNGDYHYEKTNEDVTTMKLTKISLTHKVATLFHFFLFFAFSALALTHATRFRAFTSW